MDRQHPRKSRQRVRPEATARQAGQTPEVSRLRQGSGRAKDVSSARWPSPNASDSIDSLPPARSPSPLGFCDLCRCVPAKTSAPGNSLRSKFFAPFSTQRFHLRPDPTQSRRDSFIFFRDPRDRSIDRTPADKTLKLFINAQAQHLFAATGKVSFPEIEQDNIEQGLEFKRSLGRKHGHELFGYVVGCATREESRCFRHHRL